jgi:GNAT superfamily N-acetyltransferase
VGTPRASFLVATDAVTGEVAGIAALRVFVDRVGRFLLFVDRAFRRRGCGTALMTRALRTARAAHAIHALTGRSFEAAADDEGTLGALAFLRGRGLSVAQEIVRCRAELKTALGVLEPLFQRYERGAGQPHRARIVTADQVARACLPPSRSAMSGAFPKR